MRDKRYRISPQQFPLLSFTCLGCFNGGELAVLQRAQGTDQAFISSEGDAAPHGACLRGTAPATQAPAKRAHASAPGGTGTTRRPPASQMQGMVAPRHFGGERGTGWAFPPPPPTAPGLLCAEPLTPALSRWMLRVI